MVLYMSSMVSPGIYDMKVNKTEIPLPFKFNAACFIFFTPWPFFKTFLR